MLRAAAKAYALLGLALVALIMLSPLAHAEDGAALGANQAHWSLHLKGGWFYPDIDDWEDYYGSDHSNEYALALGYHPWPFLEAGLEGRYSSDRGRGYLPLNAQIGGEVLHEVAPLGAYLTLRLIFSPFQPIVPYVSAATQRVYYQQSIQGADQNEGSTTGHSVRAGVQLLINGLDPIAAKSLQKRTGIDRTYLVFEASESSAEMDDVNGNRVDLGGKSYLFGLSFEY